MRKFVVVTTYIRMYVVFGTMKPIFRPRRFGHRLSAMLLCACLAPAASGAAPAIPARWLSAPAEGATAAASPLWWQAFSDPALDRLEARALAANHDLRAALDIALEARATARIAAAPLYPAISAGAAYGRGTQAGSNARGIELAASLDPDLFGGAHASARAARSNADASDADARMAALDLTATVASTYFELRALAERIRLARTIADDAARLLQLIEAQARLGAASRLQVEQQRDATASFAAAVPALQRLAEADRHLLSTLCGEAPGIVDLPAADLDTIPLAPVRMPPPADLLALRPDIAAAEQRMAAARFDVQAARAALLPHLSLALDGGIGADTVASLTPAGAIGGVLASLLQPVFQGGALRGHVRYSRARLDQLAEAYWQALVTALRTVEDALSDQGLLADYERTTDNAVTSARAAEQLAEAQVRLGATDYTTLLLTQRSLYQAEDTRLQIRQQRLTVAARLHAATDSGTALVRPLP